MSVSVQRENAPVQLCTAVGYYDTFRDGRMATEATRLNKEQTHGKKKDSVKAKMLPLESVAPVV